MSIIGDILVLGSVALSTTGIIFRGTELGLHLSSPAVSALQLENSIEMIEFLLAGIVVAAS